MIKRIAFLTGTRADFGKIKSLIQALDAHNQFEVHLFVTGMHMLQEYGYTLIEVQRLKIQHMVSFENQTAENTMDLSLARTIEGFSKFVRNCDPDMIVIHGDRVEALAGAIVGSLNNILTAHIEGGEISGTIDDLIRHSVSKLSHLHLVSNDQSKKRLMQMGENHSSIHVIGSPDIDLMFSGQLPDLSEVKSYYGIDFDSYAVGLFHPVTTEVEYLRNYVDQYINALVESGKNYIIVYPNNDTGSAEIIKAYTRLTGNAKFRVLPSIRFESFLTFLENADFVIGNSSAGIREAPYYGIPTINVGSRQTGRSTYKSIFHVGYEKECMLETINLASTKSYPSMKSEFGDGRSTEKFLDIVTSDKTWQIAIQKSFVELH
jgi:UDP-N-acetylglucosamine 2-epimerase (hydrolysing)